MILNFFTVIFLAFSTFAFFDISNNDTFERSITAQYLDNIGLKTHVVHLIKNVQSLQIYKQHILPNYNAAVRFLRPYMMSLRKETLTFFDWIKSQYMLFLKNMMKMNPMLEDTWRQFKVHSKKFLNNILSVFNEVTLKTAQFIQSNISSATQEKLMDTLTSFVSSTQEMAYNSYEYVITRLEKMIS